MDLVWVEVDPTQKAGELKLSDQQIRLANIQTDTVRLRPLGEEITLSATLKENQNLVNVVTSRIAGKVERLLIRNIGEPVQAGQAVFELYSEELTSTQQDYLLALQSKKRYADTDPNFARIADASRNKLLLWGMTKGQIADLEQSGKPGNTLTFYSKYSGITTEVSVAEGDEGSPMLRLANLNTLWAETQLCVSDLPFLGKTGGVGGIPFHLRPEAAGQGQFREPLARSLFQNRDGSGGNPNPGGNYQPGTQAWMTLKGRVRNAIAFPTNVLIGGKNGTTVWLKIKAAHLRAAWRRPARRTGISR